MENRPPDIHARRPPRYTCGELPEAQSSCAGEPMYCEFQGKLYCVLHCPSPDKDLARFQQAVDKKLTNRDFNFRGVWFPTEQRFTEAEFSTKADFVDAVFYGPVGFRKANFVKAAYFNRACFNGEANFTHVGFRAGVNFTDATFIELANFNYAHFNDEVDFTGTAFDRSVKFNSATFRDHVRFVTGERAARINALELQFATIEKPDRVYFHSLTVRPSWFVNVDPRRFDFINVTWNRLSIAEETASIEGRNIGSAQQMLTIVYRRLAVNAEENHRYDEASDFRYRAMESGRRERRNRNEDDKRSEVGRWLALAYWFASGYGERVWQALLVLVGIMILFAVLYTQVGFARWQPELGSEHDAATVKRDEVGAPLTLLRAFSYSGAVMTLQQPEPRPATNWAHALVLLETILGPVQAALLALAIRRKFMR